MQADQIVIAVDAANDANPANETYTRYQEFPDRSTYIGTAHVPEDRDVIAMYRTFPTRSGNFKGVSKSAVKLTKDVEVAGVDSSTTLTAPIIIDVSFSIPVGATAAEVLHARQRAVALLDTDSVMDKLNTQLMV